ncbi:YtzI protein [Halobacillus massiliensis]|uniref:YtzI protein n=1 Tax=Halobacillus massiliensis TaxID=1926286 RepID=UPI001FEB3985|nr:YtzI protein [Halobacillus massiliensis]
MTFTIVMILCVAIVLGIAGAFWAAISKGYAYKHTIDPHPEEAGESDKKDPDRL